MPLPHPEAKVTIIVETDDEVRTMVIPLAAHPMFVADHLEGIKHVKFDCYALYDIDKGVDFTWERRENEVV